jgi:hypothetical protein
MAMTPKEKAAFIAKYNNAMKDKKNRKSGEIITPGSLVRGAAKVIAKVSGETAAEKASLKVGYKAGKEVAKNLKQSKYPSAGGKTKTVRLEGEAKVKSAKGSTSTTPDAKSVTGKTPKLTEKQREAIAKANKTKRDKAIVTTAQSAKDASKKPIKKAVQQRNLAVGGLVGYIGIDKGNDLRKKKK